LDIHFQLAPWGVILQQPPYSQPGGPKVKFFILFVATRAPSTCVYVTRDGVTAATLTKIMNNVILVRHRWCLMLQLG
jgi:hypothetical protein